MRRQQEHYIQSQAPLHFRQSQAEQYTITRKQSQEAQQQKRNLIVKMFIAIKNWIENTVAFTFTLVFLIPLWIFKIVLHCFDLIQRSVRFVLWLYVKVIILMINFVFKILQFFKVTAAVNFFKKVVKKYLGNYSSENVEQAETLSGMELIMNKKQHNLIDVKKVQKKIKTPNIFLSHEGSSRKIKLGSQRLEYVQRINQELVPQRMVYQNIVGTSPRLNSPHLLNISQSHSRLKRNSTEPNLLVSPILQIETSLNRQQTTPVRRMQPDRDISPQRYNRNPLILSESSFKKKQTPEKQILLLHHNPLIHGTKTQKQLLEQELLTLRTKMQELINQNNHEIHQLEKWIQQKSQTITMTRKQNLQLLNQIQELQKENIKKNQKFTELQGKIKIMEITLVNEKNLRNGLNSQVEKLQEEIKTKTIEIMSLKQKIKKNFIHLQEMESIFGNQKFQFSPQKQGPLNEEQLQNPPVQLEQSHHSLKKDLNEIKVFDISDKYLSIPPFEEEKNISLIKQMDEIPNPKDIADVQQSHKTESEIQQSEKLILDEKMQIMSIKTSPATQQFPTKENEIKEEEKKTAQLVVQVQEFLVEEQQKLQSSIHQPVALKPFIQNQQQSQKLLGKKEEEVSQSKENIQNKEKQQDGESQNADGHKQQQNPTAQLSENTENVSKKNKKKNKKKNR